MVEERDRRNLAGEIARQGRFKYEVATAAGLHPCRFGRMLSGREPMPRNVFESTCRVLGLNVQSGGAVHFGG